MRSTGDHSGAVAVFSTVLFLGYCALPTIGAFSVGIRIVWKGMGSGQWGKSDRVVIAWIELAFKFLKKCWLGNGGYIWCLILMLKGLLNVIF